MYRGVWQDPRVVSGMRVQSQALAHAIAQGDTLRGWKLGLGAPAARQQFRLDAPLMGFLLAENFIPGGATVNLNGWTRPMLEAEIAVHLASTVSPDLSDRDLLACVAGIGPAIELLDIDAPGDDVAAIVAGNIFQRRVVAGPITPGWSDDGVRGFATAIIIDGVVVQSASDPTKLTGGIIQNLRHAAAYLAAFDHKLRPGDVLIAGSITPAVPVRANQHVAVRIEGLGSLEVIFTHVQRSPIASVQ